VRFFVKRKRIQQPYQTRRPRAVWPNQNEWPIENPFAIPNQSENLDLIRHLKTIVPLNRHPI
jgi:hypothetical protein